MKVVPEDVFTAPLEGAPREPQSTAVKGHDFEDMDNLHDLREQVGRGPHTPLAIQVAVAVMTPVETSYPLTQV